MDNGSATVNICVKFSGNSPDICCGNRNPIAKYRKIHFLDPERICSGTIQNNARKPCCLRISGNHLTDCCIHRITAAVNNKNRALWCFLDRLIHGTGIFSKNSDCICRADHFAVLIDRFDLRLHKTYSYKMSVSCRIGLHKPINDFFCPFHDLSVPPIF